ncbi:glycosyltransferase family 2 protein [Spirosoma foliorum]|uniref:Glycosyltransferase family 2 protein n=1 Tax=Spirosoma foliorum TaxID=2710596 RepID=A0A7G5GYM6_9BACT|nr:glycosyltransferase family 2 protein [Spirosoma foliorum]QMW03968.1 glycosyltransferase family 2 protein [Spirosoma foliorum]
MRKAPYLSVIVCVFNEEGNSARLIEQIQHALGALEYELIYVNDGSTDQTLNELRAVDNKRLRILDLQKNYGQSLALLAGIEAARGAFIVTLDGDLQNDPADIHHLLNLAEQGDYDLVAGIRTHRQDNFLFRKLPSRLAGFFISRVMGMRWVDYGCSLKVFRADLAKRLRLYGELHRFIPVLAYLEGARMTQMPVLHHPRQLGQSKYGLNRTLKVMSDLLLMVFLKKYLQKPMHLFGSWGLLSLAIGTGLDGYWLIERLSGFGAVNNSVLLIGIGCILAGFQFIGLGFVAELQMRTYYESQQKKPYAVRKVYEQEVSPSRIEIGDF